jgi:hypothetical protein
VPREALAELSRDLHERLQVLFDEARIRSGD